MSIKKKPLESGLKIPRAYPLLGGVMIQVGVVLVCFHTAKETLSCAKMYAAMNCVDHIVIVDNGTNKESRETFLAIDNEKIEVLFQKENNGYSIGNNRGIKYLMKKYDEEFVIVSNSDVMVSEQSIMQCLEELITHDQLGAVAPIMRDINRRDYSFRFIELGYLRMFLRVFFSERRIDKLTQRYCEEEDRIVYQSFLPGCFFIVKMVAMKKCNGFDSRVFLYKEEEILGKRLIRNGFREAVVKDCFFIHNHNYRDESAEFKFHREKIVAKSERLFFKEYLNANMLQMFYVGLMQNSYLFTHCFMWKVKDIWRYIHR